MGFDIGTNITPVSGGTPPSSTKGRALQIFNPSTRQLALHVDSFRKAGGGVLATTGARLATGFFTVGGAALTAGGLAALGASPTAVGVTIALFAANYITKLVSKPLVALGAMIAGERPGEVVKQVFS
ncbi:MAG: hypothetical protein ACAI38_04785 [Myxococcota bacterium]